MKKRNDENLLIKLEKNFRCTPGIVDIADTVIGNNDNRLPKKKVSGVLEKEGIIQADRYGDREKQFAAIAERIKKLHEQGVPYKEIAILVRKGKTIKAASYQLDNLGIPFETDSAEHFFGGNYFNRFVETLKILVDVGKGKLYEQWNYIVEGPPFSAGFRFIRGCARGANLPLSEIIRGFCDKIGFLDESAEDFENRKNDLEGIAKILDDYDEIYGDWQLTGIINGILDFLGMRAAEEYKYQSFKPKDPELDAVQIMEASKNGLI